MSRQNKKGELAGPPIFSGLVIKKGEEKKKKKKKKKISSRLV